MYVSDHRDWRADMHNVRLSHEDLLGFLAYFAQQSLMQKLFP